jgi:thiol-disulfide isomerase/thioredoxin
MRRIVHTCCVCIALVLVLIHATVSIAMESRAAPSFTLSLLGEAERMSSETLFRSFSYTFLVFWESGCPKCVEHLVECERFFEEYAGGDITVVGINSDRGDMLTVQGILVANGIRFTQLWDGTGEVTKIYGIPHGSFAVFLVAEGVVEASRLDPAGNVKELMESMLLGGGREDEAVDDAVITAAGEADARGDSHLGFTFGGRSRIRFLGIDAVGAAAVGPYGEAVNPRNNVLYRFEMEMSRSLGRYVGLGGLLRISNEDEAVLESGPQYLGSEWGSAFAEFRFDRISLRLGYYSISLTPLTLMRWDWDDNPRTGGEAGCGCGDAAGVLLVESLEELGPDLTFEGGICTYRSAGFETRLFYAIPRRAREVSKNEVRSTGADPAHYSLEIFGFGGRWQRYDSRTGLFWHLGVSAVGSWENPRSVDFLDLGYAVPDPWYDSHILTVTAEVPIVRLLAARGEVVAANRARSHGLEEATGQDDVTLKGGGGIGGIIFSWEPRVTVACDYMRLEPNFYSPLAALSYESNLEGLRLSSRLLGPRDIVAVSLFYKRLREVEVPYRKAERERFSLWGATIDMDLPSGFGCSVGWMDRGRWRSGDVHYLDEYRHSLSVTSRYLFSRGTYVQAQFQYITNSISYGENAEESRASLYSLYFTTEF